MPIAHPQTDADLLTVLVEAGTTPVIVDFFATWYIKLKNFQLIEINILGVDRAQTLRRFSSNYLTNIQT